jgi:hypothetical protein
MDADTKLAPSFQIGKREPVVAYGLMVDLANRVDVRPNIITDGFVPYISAALTFS